ncbi:hypothetical protein I4U23_005294 [Adineta vaga]|nr:hypothetical protein I4U23_005294 [Adineta vaga]
MNFICNIKFHSICSSIYISKEWIESLYLINGSDCIPSDFRVTEKSQFQLLSDLCLMSKNIVYKNNDEFIRIYLISEEELQSKIWVLMCSSQNPITPTGFFPQLNTTGIFERAGWADPKINSTLVDGFFRA